jgi:hypothetical protein
MEKLLKEMQDFENSFLGSLHLKPTDFKIIIVDISLFMKEAC